MPVFYLHSASIGILAHECLTELDSNPRQALSALVWSASWVEAAVSDLYWAVMQFPNKGDPPELERLRRFVPAFDLLEYNTKVDRRLAAYYLAMTDSSWPRDVGPWPDYKLMRALRNHVVHQRPEGFKHKLVKQQDGTTLEDATPNKFITRLVSMQLIEKPEQGTYPLMSALLDPRVARWAFGTAQLCGSALLDLLPAGNARVNVENSFRYVLQLSP